MVYLDYAATTPITDQALLTYQQIAKDYYGNASSLHDIGGQAKDILEQARQIIAGPLHADPREIIFTNGGTESNVLAIDTLLRSSSISGKKHIISTEMEHSSLLFYLEHLNQLPGYEVTFLPGEKEGQIDINALKQAIRPNTCLISIQHVNSETGVIQPLAEIGQCIKDKGIAFHSDIVQSFGKIDVTRLLSFVDCMSMSSHKIHGPKGVGAVYFSKKLTLKPHPIKTNHEFGLRPGTVNVPAIAAFAAATSEIFTDRQAKEEHLHYIRDLFINRIEQENIPLKLINTDYQSPTIAGCFNPLVQGDYVMLEYNRRDIHLSTGTACSSNQQKIPASIQPFMADQEEGKRFNRFSFSHTTTAQEVEEFIAVSKQIFSKMKGEKKKYEQKVNG
ncbi:IscS subfamily cysteine desulfurase [Gracilibacillus caseinilyticus]|uniref:IscS subfamily cysteine desulfurase n=1 Tax=Gracilibacillus caseinilyticus TaxID=2932256 RepID=A0ABY4EU54_9BACI|nr:IscS subfamily cysteine desulfurase [Gracilibacillus caseinilyticus]UOQ47312.1 IscS subfamily cysteine desulfurase [Gracilibacillus caseinilyticus]